MNPFMKSMIKWSDGNPGAAVFLMGLFEEKNLPISLSIMAKIERCEIKGTDLYILFSDLCNKDYIKVSLLCHKCPDDVLKDACSRQDYSGQALVKEYLK